MTLRRLLLVTCAASLAAQVDAAELRGVWRGELGKSPVVACFESATAGGYYYEAHRTSIPLSRENDVADWIEGDDDTTGHWRDLRVDPQVLLATWRAAAGGRTAPIRLARVADLAPEGDCRSSTDFNAPRRAATPVRLGEPQSTTVDSWLTGVPVVPGPRVRQLTALPDDPDASLRVLQLEDRDAGAQRINAQLRAWLDEAIIEHYECRNMGGQGERDYEADALAHHDARWLTVRTVVRWTCGGPYPGAAIAQVTFDRQSGELVDPNSWIAGDAQAPGDMPEILAKRLGTLAVRQRFDPKHPDDDADCSDSYDGWRAYQVWPAPGGLAFAPTFPHVVQACIEEVFMPAAELEPFLSDDGRAALSPDRR
jgi:hypothetical protein